MTPNLDDLTFRERRLCEVIAAFYQATEDGHAPELKTLIQEHPDLQVELRRYFVEEELLHKVTRPLRSAEGYLLGSEDVGTLRDDSPVLASLVEPGRIVDGVRRFGDYELLQELAIGGMGIIFKARQISLNRLVALKMIRSGEFATESDIRRFRAEAETVADLDHPNIVPIYEVGEHDGYHFFSMKLLEGGTLAAHLDRYRSDPRAAARVISTLAGAMLHAHLRGILHRDLKPSNILLDAGSEPMIADFGLAKRIDATIDLTVPGALIGTPPYFAPEVTLGRKGAITTATDVYGLGAILYALLTGRAPFQAESVWELIEKVKEQPPEPPRHFNPEVDVDLQTICLKCLEKDPGARYAGVRGLAGDLNRWLSGEPIEARPGDWRHRAWLWCRHPARQSEAGHYAVVLGVLFTLWAAIGVTSLSLGLIEVPSPGTLLIHVSCFILLAYLPMVLLGWFAMSRKAWAIRSGLLHSAVFMTINTINLLGVYTFGAENFTLEQNPLLHSMSHTFLHLAFAFIVAAYAIANISLNAGRRSSLPKLP